MLVFLIGFMGSGKTTLGRQLASEAGLTFADLDGIIETGAGKDISEIFKEIGEERFRVLEHETLLKIFQLKKTVVAVGGGTPCFFNNMELMNRAGITIYLKYPPEILFKFLKEEPDTRPLISGMADKELLTYIRYKLQERKPFYEQAKHILTWPDITVKRLEEILGREV